MIASIAGDIGISSKICTKIKCSHGQIFIDVMIRTGSWQNLSQVSSSLQKRLFDALVTHIGLAAIKKINVVVVGFRLPKRICAREQFQTDNDKVSGSCYFDGRQSEE
jgi:uncharacterized alkaline shock family protein YloU